MCSQNPETHAFMRPLSGIHSKPYTFLTCMALVHATMLTTTTPLTLLTSSDSVAAAVKAPAAMNPYAQMTELPYPTAYGAQDVMAPPGMKVPLAGVPQGPLVPQPPVMMMSAAPPAAAAAGGFNTDNAV